MELIIQLGVTLLLLFLGYSVGSYREKKHLTNIRKREKSLLDQAVLSVRPSAEMLEGKEGEMFVGSVVISIDYFKRFASSLRNLIGGRVESLIPLTERGRREAILRLREQAQLWGATEIVNLRLETSSISKSSQGNSIGSVEIFAYATGLRPKKQA